MLYQDDVVTCYSYPSSHGMQIPLVAVTGKGSKDNPLRLVHALRHFDGFDESTDDEAFEKASATLDALFSSFIKIVINDTVSRESAFCQLNNVLQTGSIVAEIDTYYSAIIAVLAAERLIVAGIGRVTASASSLGYLRPLIKPNIFVLPKAPVWRPMLNGTLGVGFDPEKISNIEVNLEPGGFAVLTIENKESSTPEVVNAEERPVDSTRISAIELLAIRSPKPSIFSLIKPVI